MNKSFNADDAIGKHLASHPSYSDFLCHHGIKGQKWGVKKDGHVYTNDDEYDLYRRPWYEARVS